MIDVTTTVSVFPTELQPAARAYVRRGKGHRIGATIVGRIIEEHGGSIELRDAAKNTRPAGVPGGIRFAAARPSSLSQNNQCP